MTSYLLKTFLISFVFIIVSETYPFTYTNATCDYTGPSGFCGVFESRYKFLNGKCVVTYDCPMPPRLNMYHSLTECQKTCEKPRSKLSPSNILNEVRNVATKILTKTKLFSFWKLSRVSSKGKVILQKAKSSLPPHISAHKKTWKIFSAHNSNFRFSQLSYGVIMAECVMLQYAKRKPNLALFQFPKIAKLSCSTIVHTDLCM